GVARTVPVSASRPALHAALPIFAPITGVHFWFDRTVMDEPFVTLLDATTQWIFNKTALFANSHGKENIAPAGQYLQLVISASYRSEEHTSELQSRENLVCRLLLE